MLISLLDDESLPTDLEGLEVQIKELERKTADCSKEIAKLMREEVPHEGIFFAAEIHKAKQLLLMLRYQKDLRTVRKNQIMHQA